jgi:hypothetical protein
MPRDHFTRPSYQSEYETWQAELGAGPKRPWGRLLRAGLELTALLAFFGVLILFFMLFR